MDAASTIFAVSSPPGVSARGIVRWCGPDAFAALHDVSGWSGAGRGAAPVLLRIPEGELPSLALWSEGESSATGFDTVELLLPGNPALLELVVDRVMAASRGAGGGTRGAGDAGRGLLRRALPGEFLARAWSSGRISLVEAEGVAAAIAAGTAEELAAADELRQGRLGEQAAKWSMEIASLAAAVEVGIDFIDEGDVAPVSASEVVRRATTATQEIGALQAAAAGRGAAEVAWRVVLRGPTNAGKSTLFNALLGRKRVAVSAEAGSTRDAVEEPMPLPAGAALGTVMLSDAPGELEAVPGSIEALTQDVARRAEARADLVLRCVPAGGARPAAAPGEILVLTKCDLVGEGAELAGGSSVGDLGLSVLAGVARTARGADGALDGVEAVRREIALRLASLPRLRAGGTMALSARHIAALADAEAALREAATRAGGADASGNLSQPELVAADLRRALDAIGTISGSIDPDDVLGLIFSRFCIGK